ncbi:helix-turn-helix domain-containing protein [Nocardia transvalensis]|uniref:helix-turn-helix domain-containing protein n=1 Tax=Nocardia transvalensis TaxID=37333 RepID=UPI001892D666|nr:helix-turn-helix domain-containing protein [Nocardia transvalensis]MBF6329013.1 helix-turn-helix domain-containing protein [Nocardia transvalensis]
MSQSLHNLGNFIRERRVAANLTQGALADLVGISEETLSAIERNKRPISQSVLGPLLAALGVYPDAAPALVAMYAVPVQPESNRPTPHETSALEAIATPAFYQDVRTYRIIHSNAAVRRALPGMTAGTNLMEWLLTEPDARAVLADWESVAHRFVYSMRALALPSMPPEISGPLIRACSRAPEWDRMWNTTPADATPMNSVTLVDPATGAHQPMYLTSFTLQFPRAGWGMWMLSPAREPLT